MTNLIRKGKMLIIFLFSYPYTAQKITVENKTAFPVSLQYLQKKVKLEINQKATISEKRRVGKISVISANTPEKGTEITLFLHPEESLGISVKSDSIVFKGEKAALHNYVSRHLMTELSMKIFEYQKYYGKNDAAGFIRISESALEAVLKKAEQMNRSPAGREDLFFKEIEAKAKERWFFTVFVCINSGTLDLTGKELMLHYYEKYFKKDIAGYTCNSGTDYDILRKYAVNRKLLKLQLPVYEIIEHTDDDEINRYLPVKCQEFYFRERYHFLTHRHDIRAEQYKKILAEKFHVIL